MLQFSLAEAAIIPRGTCENLSLVHFFTLLMQIIEILHCYKRYTYRHCMTEFGRDHTVMTYSVNIHYMKEIRYRVKIA